MRFSIIMPSMLSDYPGAATKRNQKLIRAVQSILDQSFTDFELLVIADGCDTTEYIVKKYFSDNRIRLLRTERNGLWTNNARNAGIEAAHGDYITYLDSDDKWGQDHLKIIADNLIDEDWVYSNDWIYEEGIWRERKTDIKQYGRCGTSNICHARRLNLRWEKTGYGHDFHFIQQLRKLNNNRQIPAAQYYVCHVGMAYEV